MEPFELSVTPKPEIREERLAYIEPEVKLLGTVEELTGSNGKSYDDGWNWQN